MGEQETIKRKIAILILMPLLLCSFLSVGYSAAQDFGVDFNTFFVSSITNPIIDMQGKDWALKVDSALASSIDSRNTPYMTAKSSTEKELFLELASLEDCKSGVVQFKVDMTGLTAYKQLPLTQKEIDEGSFRPKNVENSYALFDDSGKKVAHIYGSKITDSKGAEVWLDQNLQDGLLTVILPKPEELATLTFPLLLDPTFGYTTIGGTGGTFRNNLIRYFNYNITENGTLQYFSVYTTNSGYNIKVALYSDNAGVPETKLAESNISATIANGWVNCSATYSLTTGAYWFGVMADDNLAGGLLDAGGRAGYHSGVTYPTFPDTASTMTNDNYQWSIFATYTVEEEPTPTPTPFASATPFPEGAMDDTDWWISILVVMLIIINIFLMMLPFALVRFVFGILSLFLCMLALTYQIPLSPYLQTAGLLISALAMLFSVRARE